ncbi:hypothetical protein Hanom_Chr15g01359151 [Helianthus anomalus]
MEFNKQYVPLNQTVEQIKEQSFFWINCRSKYASLNWGRWCDFSLRDIVL